MSSSSSISSFVVVEPETFRQRHFAWLPSNWDDWNPPDPQAIEEDLKKEFTDKERADAWDKAAQAVKVYHDELVEQWQKAMDSVLVYAGLFSAVLTAFNVQSYPLLQPASNDPMLAALQQISVQLNSFSINPSFINSTQPALSPNQLQPPFRAPVSAIWINILWFSSLVCSLASASIALTAKQWLYEESQGLSGTSREAARLRQYRLDSLIKWRVGVIVLVPSVLLQVALFLFLAGLLVLLWSIHHTVAALITALTGVLFLFMFLTTIIPTFAPDCCYRSPQAYGVFIAMRLALHRVYYPLLQGLLCQCGLLLCLLWIAIPWRHSRLFRIVDNLCDRCRDWNAGHIPTWKGAEQNEVARNTGLLDRHIATTAYTTTSGVEHLEALHILFSDLPCNQALACFPDIHRFWIHLWGANDAVRRSGKLAGILLGKPFHYALRQILALDPDKRDPAVGNEWMELSSGPGSLFASYETVMGYIPPSAQHLSTLALISIGDSVLAKKTLNLLVACLDYCLCNNPMPFIILYDVLKDVMATARWTIEIYVPPDEEKLWHMFQAVAISLRCTRSVLTDDFGLTRGQEAWIRHETWSLLSSLREKLSIQLSEDSRAEYVKYKILQQLITLCEKVTRGYEMIPEGLLLKITEHLQPGSLYRDRTNDLLNTLQSIVQEQERKERHKEHDDKPCFYTQLPLATVF